MGTNVVKFVDRLSLFEPAEILFVVGQARVVKHHHFNRVPITPEMFVVSFNGFGEIAQAVSGYNKNSFGSFNLK